MLRKAISLAILAIPFAGGGLYAAETISLEPVADATLYEGEGDLANGSGTFFFTGRTDNRNGAVERRALIAFDVGSSIPDGATITLVSLEVTMSRTTAGSQRVELHRILESWGEGPSDAAGQEGGGADSGAGDATWVHRDLTFRAGSTIRAATSVGLSSYRRHLLAAPSDSTAAKTRAKAAFRS